MKLSELAAEIGLDYSGADREISAINTLNDAQSSELSFLHNSKYTRHLETTQAAAVLLEEEHAHHLPPQVVPLVTDEPYVKMALASRLFAKPLARKSGADPVVGSGCTLMAGVNLGRDVVIGNNVTLMSGVFVGDDVTIGDGTVLHPNVVVYHGCAIGEGCIVHSGTVIGSDGFGFAQSRDGSYVKIFQNGNVIIDDDVEIGANTTIDRAVFGSTRIKAGAKIDNLVQIGHNSVIGENVILVSQVGISGSTTLGRNVIMGGQSATAGHLEIGEFATIAARGGVTKTIEGHQHYAGFPLMNRRHWLKLQGMLAKMLKG